MACSLFRLTEIAGTTESDRGNRSEDVDADIDVLDRREAHDPPPRLCRRFVIAIK
jgi:hypothetical protein